ncbi:hypothetical protein BMS3Abin14_01639 [bacterium BMS3Abin14]|nr:hypothetical protein BMS3Abin14_01639 [bacterium BMS3Abin14]
MQVRLIPGKIMCDVVGGDRESEDPPFGVPFTQDLQESPVEHIHLMLKFRVCLLLRFAADYNRLPSQDRRRMQIERQVGEGRLKADSRRHIDVEDEFLKGLFDLSVFQPVVSDEGCQKGVKVGKCLCTGGFALQGVEKVDDLSQSCPEMACGAALRFPWRTPETHTQNILQVPAYTVSCELSQIVNVQIP